MAHTPGVELAGYLGAAVGVGEASRRYLDALRSAGVPVVERDVALPGRDDARTALAAGPRAEPAEVTCNLLCLNPEQMVPYLDGPDAPVLDGRATVGVWSWEVDVLPPGWREAGARLAEVWTYSRFAAKLIAPHVDVPVLAVPPPISRPAMGQPGTPSVELPRGFRVLVMFDYLSTLERKNPLGAIAAYLRAFSPQDGTVLIVKSVNGRHRPQQRAELLEALGGRPDIVTIDETMSGPGRDALIAACDCYLSLHRSEGHGLPLAEAMALGKPVVATAYGGNTEFMNEGNSYLVPWSAAPVGEGVEHYPATARWAEPDVEQAAQLLRSLHDDREQGARRARRGQADVRAQLSPEVVGAQILARLSALGQAARRSSPRRGMLRRVVRAAPRRWR